LKKWSTKDNWGIGTLRTTEDIWELYHMEQDFNEQVNLAKKYPKKLKELRKAFEKEARKYHVYPLHDSWFPANKYLQISDSRDKEAKDN
jgi:arylsulfatase A-like enzyme